MEMYAYMLIMPVVQALRAVQLLLFYLPLRQQDQFQVLLLFAKTKMELHILLALSPELPAMCGLTLAQAFL